ncbi:hypothetical protein L6452_37649 [Arctium lappa]|uniref:Uncharacterized protein n=1 Tax=Arctium lappa TaxID=4217 RepID=A0ACB8Y480_ARCLA|nr:hypothetical protein L6452_37649 [Arctium lappa]
MIFKLGFYDDLTDANVFRTGKSTLLNHCLFSTIVYPDTFSIEGVWLAIVFVFLGYSIKARQLPYKWSTRAGPRIDCLRDYPLELPLPLCNR